MFLFFLVFCTPTHYTSGSQAWWFRVCVGDQWRSLSKIWAAAVLSWEECDIHFDHLFLLCVYLSHSASFSLSLPLFRWNTLHLNIPNMVPFVYVRYYFCVLVTPQLNFVQPQVHSCYNWQKLSCLWHGVPSAKSRSHLSSSQPLLLYALPCASPSQDLCFHNRPAFLFIVSLC